MCLIHVFTWIFVAIFFVMVPSVSLSHLGEKGGILEVSVVIGIIIKNNITPNILFILGKWERNPLC